jgi:hypothetical protein
MASGSALPSERPRLADRDFGELAMHIEPDTASKDREETRELTTA